MGSLARLNQLFDEYTQGGEPTTWKNYTGEVNSSLMEPRSVSGPTQGRVDTRSTFASQMAVSGRFTFHDWLGGPNRC